MVTTIRNAGRWPPDRPKGDFVDEPHTSDSLPAAGDPWRDTGRLWERVVPLFSTVESRLDRVLLHRHGIGLASLMALGAVTRSHPEPATVGSVARHLGVNASSASRLLAQLEQSGWVNRSSAPCDRRISRLRATEAGRGVWDRASRTLDHELRTAFHVLAFHEKYAHIVARLCRTGGTGPCDGPSSP
ncbi:MarR family winged helix-turn-helix transcriptional regulator [Streptomyces minutiscleroticus]|uniref:HTH marR-type domain-containing protein n=1 Tax=Streptomyces minutiscleroticus TaxID=68238 RepID=A0A918P0Z4_9ACTN|nr:MarR family transcriptional regulator [Streptomyces minutiscleroticus]GGY12484.1 hypothetical protein GCM10010358_76060 [Streptomyces minutiscleroticus]